MERIDILLMCEHTARELDVACAVKYLLRARHGLRAEIAHQPYGVPEALARYLPRVVAVPFCYADFQRHYPFLFDWPNAAYINLAWEELFYPGNVQAKLPRGRFETEHVHHHAWGEFYVDVLRGQGVPAGNIHLNGHPAYALYDEPYRHYFLTREALAERHRLDPAKRWVFFPENYNWAFYADWKVDELRRAGRLDQASMDHMVHYTRQSFEAVMGWCAQLAQQDSVELIVRPRPLTPLADFRAAAAQVAPDLLERARVLKDESVREWILASDVVVSSYSTSLIEAGVAGKPAFILEPLPMPPLLAVDWQQHVPRLRTAAELIVAGTHATAANHDNRIGAWARETMLARGDPISGLADILAGMRRRPRTRRMDLNSLTIHTRRRPWVPRWMWFGYQRAIDRRKRRTLPAELSPYYENDRFEPGDIARRVQRWAEVLEAAPAAQALG